jgi:hypothetical protein
MLNILQQFEQLAAHTTSTVAKYAVQSVPSSMIESIPSKSQSPDCIFSSISASLSNSAIRPLDDYGDATTISSLLETYADQLEVNCSLLEQNIQLSSKVHELKANMLICEQHNLKLDADCSQLQSAVSALHATVEPPFTQIDDLLLLPQLAVAHLESEESHKSAHDDHMASQRAGHAYNNNASDTSDDDDDDDD